MQSPAAILPRHSARTLSCAGPTSIIWGKLRPGDTTQAIETPKYCFRRATESESGSDRRVGMDVVGLKRNRREARTVELDMCIVVVDLRNGFGFLDGICNVP